MRKPPEFRTVDSVAHCPKPRDGIPAAIFNDLKKVGDAVSDITHQEFFLPAGWDLDWFFALLSDMTTGTEPPRTLGGRSCDFSGWRSSPHIAGCRRNGSVLQGGCIYVGRSRVPCTLLRAAVHDTSEGMFQSASGGRQIIGF